MRTYKIGRSRNCDVVLAEESISREHATITPKGNSQYEISDAGSSHGTFIENGGVWVRVEDTALIGRDEPLMLGRYETKVGELLAEFDREDEDNETDEVTDQDLELWSEGGRRRLAAIVAMDVVGFSAKMGQDETRTLAVMSEVRSSIIDPGLRNFNGRLFKEIGDGLMLEFGSVNDAVMFSVDTQRRMVAYNAHAPEHRRLEFRIGINIGDVIIQGDDLMGDGVNIAARLEPMADSGGICLSGIVRDLIKTKLDLGFKDLGNKQLKNIANPIRVFSLGGGVKKAKKKRKGFLPI
ncbi:MAG: FHA domain-containing protein [Alphaproteobacteria bacterium]|nr:FHA domain-containing protein [Alphaproteobacteria bacterium]